MFKKIIFICTLICTSVFFALPCSALVSDYDNSNYQFFTGSDYDGVSAPIGLPSGDLSDKYILSYSGWQTGTGQHCDVTYCALPASTEYLTFISLGSPDNFRLTWSGGQGIQRLIRYNLNPFETVSDIQNTTGQFNSPGRYGALFTNVPIRDQTGQPIFTPATPATFDMHSVVDSYGVIHFSTTTEDTFPANTSFNATYYLINGSYDTPNYIGGYITTVQQVDTYNIYTYNVIEGFYNFLRSHLSKLTGGSPPRELYTYSIENVSSTQKQSFNISYYPQNVFYGTGTLSNSFGNFKPIETSVDCFQLQNMKGQGGIYSNDHLAMICVLSSSNGNYYICRQDFNSKDVKNKVISDFSQNLRDIIGSQTEIELPEHQDAIGKQITDLQDLAEYLQYVYNTTNSNSANYFYNGIQSLDDADWGVIAPFFTTPITAGFADLSGEIDNLFDWAYVPTSAQMDEIQDDIDTAETEFRDKFSWVDDVKSEMYFVSTTIRSAGSDTPVFTAQMLMPNAPDNPSFSDYVSITLFDGSWVDSTTRQAVKDVITCFACLGLLIYVFKTLPSTVGNMPSD